MSIKEKLSAYFRLLRFQSGAYESVLILIGALLLGQRNLSMLLVIFFLGLLYHIFGFVLNDYIDVEVDRKSAELSKKPLVSGIIPKNHALFISVSAVVVLYILTLIFFPFLFSIFLLTIAVLLGIIYDYFGKKITILPDFIVAGSLAFIFLFGASLGPAPFTFLIYILCLLIFFSIVFANAVEGGLKDVDHDFLGGAKTLPVIMGVSVKDGKLKMTRKFFTFALGLEMTCFALILLMSIQPEIDLWQSDYTMIIIAVLLIILLVFASFSLLYLRLFDRTKIKRIYAAINGAAGALIILMLLPLMGLEITIVLLLLPFVWYITFNFVLYGKPFQPDV